MSGETSSEGLPLSLSLSLLLLPPPSSHLVVLSRRVLDDLHGGRQGGVSLLVLLLLPAALHPRGRLGEEVTIFTEDSLMETDTRHTVH